MPGVVIPGTGIAVDCWRNVSGVRLFFLSHMHTDHTEGLRSSWNFGTIFASELSARLLQHRLGVPRSRIEVLELGVPRMLPLGDDETVTVTPLDANHCPGAVMYLFEGAFGTVLHTGDFRFRPELFELHPILKTKVIDRLYLDNTYCHPQYVFDAQHIVQERIAALIRKHPDSDVVFGIDTLGKEELIIGLAKTFGTLVYADEKRLNQLRVLGLDDVFTSEVDDARFRVVYKRFVTGANVREWNTKRPTIAIAPSGWASATEDKNMHKRPRAEDAARDAETQARVTAGPSAAASASDVAGTAAAAAASAGFRSSFFLGADESTLEEQRTFFEPYSLHSSFGELCAFMDGIRARSMVPVNDYNAQLQTYLGKYLYADGTENPFDAHLARRPRLPLAVAKPDLVLPPAQTAARAPTTAPVLPPPRKIQRKLAAAIRRNDDDVKEEEKEAVVKEEKQEVKQESETAGSGIDRLVQAMSTEGTPAGDVDTLLELMSSDDEADSAKGGDCSTPANGNRYLTETDTSQPTPVADERKQPVVFGGNFSRVRSFLARLESGARPPAHSS